MDRKRETEGRGKKGRGATERGEKGNCKWRRKGGRNKEGGEMEDNTRRRSVVKGGGKVKEGGEGEGEKEEEIDWLTQWDEGVKKKEEGWLVHRRKAGRGGGKREGG